MDELSFTKDVCDNVETAFKIPTSIDINIYIPPTSTGIPSPKNVIHKIIKFGRNKF